MAFPKIQSIKSTAYQQVADAGNATRLMLLHAGIPAAISLVLTFISYLLSLQIEDTGGLGGLGQRSLLQSAQSMLQVISVIFSVFWTCGLHRITLLWSRGERALDSDLLAGFHHIGPVLRTGVLRFVLYIAVVLLAFQLSTLVFSMTPLAAGLTALAQQLVDDPSFMPTESQLLDAMKPYLPFLLVFLMILVVPVFYRLRMMEFALMDAPEKGALHAWRMSMWMMRGNCWKLFKLDLHFWWFYLLECLTAFLFYGDWALQLLDMDFGLSADLLFFLACILGLAAQLALYVWRKNQVMTAYALIYQTWKPQEQVQ